MLHSGTAEINSGKLSVIRVATMTGRCSGGGSRHSAGEWASAASSSQAHEVPADAFGASSIAWTTSAGNSVRHTCGSKKNPAASQGIS